MSGDDDLLALGPYLLDRRQRRLTRDGDPVPLGSRAFDTLTVLAAASGQTLTKNQLLERIWPGLTVEENNLQVQVSALRKVLGEGWILTVPGRGYRLIAPRSGAPPTPALPDKPSLVVLPFQSLSGDPEHDYFVDGLVADITTALSCIRSLFVIACNSAFTYKGRTVDVRQVGRELGVRYVLEGSVRKAGGRVRITAQLIEAATGAHLWADRFDGALDDVFDLQDRVTANVAGAFEPHLQRAEIERAQRKPTQDLSAYDYFLRGMAIYREGNAERMPEARAQFAKAWALDPGYGAAYGAAAVSFNYQKSAGRLLAGGPEITEAVRLARLAVEVSQHDATALCDAASAMSYVGGQPEVAVRLIQRARGLNPNSAQVWFESAFAKLFLGDPDGVIADIERATRLSPVDRFLYSFHMCTSAAHFFAGRYDDAVMCAERALSEHPGHPPSHRYLAAGLAMSGRPDEARRVMADLMRLAPRLRLSNKDDWMAPYRRPEYAVLLIEALRLAGLPD